MRKQLPILLAVLFAVTLLFAPGDAMGCPNCKDAMPAARDADTGSVAQGFYYSILVMMAAPFLLATTFGGTIWYFARKPQGIVE